MNTTALLTTLIPLIIIVGFFLYYYKEAKGFVTARKLLEDVPEEGKLEVLAETELGHLVHQYQGTINIETPEGKKTNYPAAEYFNKDSISWGIHLNVRALDSAAGTLVGLGLLGTFAGLTFGIAGFDGSNAAHIQTSIQTLMNGMWTAFLTSIFGMVLSIVYTILDKRHRNQFEKTLIKFTDELDYAYYIDDNALNVLKQQEIAQHISDQIADLMTQKMDELNSKLTYQKEDGSEVPLGNAIREMLVENQEQSKALKSFSTDLAIELNNGFDEVLSRQMQEKIPLLMEKVDETMKVLTDHIDKVGAQVQSPASDMIGAVVTELKESMSQVIAEFKSSITSSATSEMESLAKQLGTAANVMTAFPQNMENITATLQATIEQVKTSVADISNTSANANNTAMKQMQEQITLATAAMSNAMSEVKDVMGQVTQNSQQSSRDVMRQMQEAADKMSEQLNATVTDISSQVKAAMADISNTSTNASNNAMKQMQEQVMGTTNAMNSAIADVKNVMGQITQASHQTSEDMTRQMQEATSKVGELLNATIADISKSVKAKMNDMADDVVSKQTDLLALQEETMTKTRGLLSTFGQSIDRLEQMNEQMSGSMDKIKQAQGEITGTTSHLQTIASNMKEATDTFSKSQNDYADNMDKLQKVSQGSIESVTNLLKDSGEATKDYVDQFDMIKNGLSQIFNQLQQGLTEYSKTVQANTQSFLDKYSTSLTDTTNALSSTIQQQSEVAEMLAETIGKIKK